MKKKFRALRLIKKGDKLYVKSRGILIPVTQNQAHDLQYIQKEKKRIIPDQDAIALANRIQQPIFVNRKGRYRQSGQQQENRQKILEANPQLKQRAEQIQIQISAEEQLLRQQQKSAFQNFGQNRDIQLLQQQMTELKEKAQKQNLGEVFKDIQQSEQLVENAIAFAREKQKKELDSLQEMLQKADEQKRAEREKLDQATKEIQQMRDKTEKFIKQKQKLYDAARISQLSAVQSQELLNKQLQEKAEQRQMELLEIQKKAKETLDNVFTTQITKMTSDYLDNVKVFQEVGMTAREWRGTPVNEKKKLMRKIRAALEQFGKLNQLNEASMEIFDDFNEVKQEKNKAPLIFGMNLKEAIEKASRKEQELAQIKEELDEAEQQLIKLQKASPVRSALSDKSEEISPAILKKKIDEMQEDQKQDNEDNLFRGNGVMNLAALSNIDIENTLKNIRYFEGVYNQDEYDQILAKLDTSRNMQIFVINPFKRNYLKNNSGHWIAMVINYELCEICWFDPLALDIEIDEKKLLNKIISHIKEREPNMYKLKQNLYPIQNIDSALCGYYVLLFIALYIDSLDFKIASMYEFRNNKKELESAISKFPFI